MLLQEAGVSQLWLSMLVLCGLLQNGKTEIASMMMFLVCAELCSSSVSVSKSPPYRCLVSALDGMFAACACFHHCGGETIDIAAAVPLCFFFSYR